MPCWQRSWVEFPRNRAWVGDKCCCFRGLIASLPLDSDWAHSSILLFGLIYNSLGIGDWRLVKSFPSKRPGDPHVKCCVLIAKLGLLWVSEWGLDAVIKDSFMSESKTQMPTGARSLTDGPAAIHQESTVTKQEFGTHSSCIFGVFFKRSQKPWFLCETIWL